MGSGPATLSASLVLLLGLWVGASTACGESGAGDSAPDGEVGLAAEVGQRVVLAREGESALPDVALELEPGTWVRLALRQEGVDIAATVVGPEGRRYLSVDSPTGGRGREPVGFLARQGGVYRLHLDTFSGDGRLVVEVLEARPAVPEDTARARAYRRLARGLEHWIEDAPAAAELELSAAAAGLQAADDLPALADAHRWLGAVRAARGEAVAASAAYARAAAGYRSAGEPWAEAKALNARALLLRRLGSPEEAEAALLRALALFTTTADAEARGTVLHNLGVLRRGVGRLAEAEEALRHALAARRSLADGCDVATTQRELGSLHALVGRDEEALDLLREALPMVEPCSPGDRLAGRVALGWAYHLKGSSKEALEHLEMAVEMARREGSPRQVMGAVDRRSTVLAATGRHGEAREGFLEALKLARGFGDRLAEGHVLGNLGRLAARSGDLRQARAWLGQAVRLLAEAGDAEAEAATRLELARVERRRGADELALQHLEAAMRRVESVRAGLDSVLSRSFFLSHRREIYEELTELWMERHRREPASAHHLRALEVAERGRARGLLDSVAQPAGEGGSRAAGTGYLAAIGRLDAERVELRRAGAEAAELEEIDRRIRRLALAAERTLSGGSVPAQPLDAAGMASLLDAETQLLAFALGESASYLWLVDPGGEVRVFDLPPRPLLVAAAGRAAAALATPRAAFAGARESALAHLSDLLLAEAAPNLRASRLVVVPDGALGALPFAVFPWPGGGGERLLDRFAVSVLPSPSVLAVQRRIGAAERHASAGAWVFADPVYREDDPRVGRGGPPPAVAEVAVDLRRAARDLGLWELPRLSHTAREAAAIREVRPGGAVHVASGFEATRARLRELSGERSAVLHFATHALLHPAHPQLSGVVLSMVDEAGRPVDGFLRAWEVAGLDLPAEMVVLSACSTGLGREIPGEGFVGLPHAFFGAGARRVVVSHWPVDDAATAELMAAFYRGAFRDGLDPAAALARAQREVRSQERWMDPYYWAGFSLLGEWRPLPSQQN